MKKFLAFILTLAVIAASLLTCLSVQATENEYVYTPADSVGYNESYLLVEQAQVGKLTGDALAAVAPRIADGGVAGSNAMEVGGDITFNRYLVPFRITGLTLDTTYVIQMDVKRTSGNISKIQSGVWRTGAYNYSATEYTNKDISSDGFTTLTFESSLSGTYIPHYLIFTFSTTSAGGVMLIDNIVVYEKDDETKTNLFDSNLDVDTGTDAPGTFDKGRALWFDNTVDEELVYTPVELTESSHRPPTNLTTGISQLGEGVKGSYALKLTGMASKQSTLYFQPNVTGFFTVGAEYTIEMKIKKTAGTVNTNGLTIGINEGGTLYWTNTILDSELSDEWEYYKWNHTITKGGWQYLAFRFTSGSEAAVIVVDDIKVYLASDTAKTPLKFEADLDADCDFDAKVEYKLTDKCGEYDLVNDIILVDEAGTAVSAFKTACSAPSIVTVKLLDGETAMEDSALVKTGTVLSATVEGNETTYTIAVKYDVNSNGSFDIADIVKTARIKEGGTASAAQLVAANVTDGTVTDANMLALRLALLGK